MTFYLIAFSDLIALLTLISKEVKDQQCTGFVFLSIFNWAFIDYCNLISNFIGLCGFGIKNILKPAILVYISEGCVFGSLGSISPRHFSLFQY